VVCDQVSDTLPLLLRVEQLRLYETPASLCILEPVRDLEFKRIGLAGVSVLKLNQGVDL
jgi:hypothetical protein